MVKHLYQRTISHNGKKIKAWYYWFYDENGKQVRKSCGQHGKPCLVKRDAQAYIESINDEDLLPKSKTPSITLNDFAKDFYAEKSPFVIKSKNRGNELTPQTIKHKNAGLKVILNKFGTFEPNQLTVMDFDNWLLSLDRSNSWRNHLQCVIEELYEEMYLNRIVQNPVYLKRFAKINLQEKGILYPDEIKLLWPDDDNEALKKWKLMQCSDEDAYVFMVMAYTIITTGMRSCEIRALQWNQFIRDDAILVNKMIDGNNKEVNFLKKGSENQKKWRTLILPERTIRYLNTMAAMTGRPKEGYVFLYKNERMKSDYLLNHLCRVLKKNGIDHKARDITVHSLRFTYNTMMRPQIEGKDLRLMMGHTKEIMTDYYDKSKALEHLPELLENKDIINSIFN